MHKLRNLQRLSFYTGIKSEALCRTSFPIFSDGQTKLFRGKPGCRSDAHRHYQSVCDQLLHPSLRCASSNTREAITKEKPTSAKLKITSELLESLENEETVLDLFNKFSTTTVEISLILNKLVDLHGNDCIGEPSPLVKQAKFRGMMKVLDGQVVNLPVKVLISCLKNLIELHQSDDLPVIKSLYTQLQWLIRKMPVGQLFSVYEGFPGRSTTPLSLQIHNEAHENLLRRWVEISDPRQIVSLLYSLDRSQERHLANLETRTLDLCEKMSTKELYRVLYILAKQRRRNTPLIRSVVYHMKKQKISLTPVHLGNLGFACSTLNIFDGKLLEMWNDEILENIKESKVSKTVAVSMLRSVGILRWRHERLVDELSSLVLDSSTNMEDIVVLLRTCSVVNYVPEALRKNVQRFSENFHSDNPKLVLDLIWSTAVLKMLQEVKPLVAIVLCNEFLDRLKASSTENLNGAYLKLVNINTAARLDLPDYEGPYLPDDFYLQHDLKITVPQQRPLVDKIIGAFSQMAPGDKYLQRDAFHQSGQLIDAIFFVDFRGQIVPLTSGKAEISNHHRLAVKILDFSDLTLGNVQAIGRHTMHLEHLVKDGIKIFTIPFYDCAHLDTNVKQVQYLQQKIKSCIND